MQNTQITITGAILKNIKIAQCYDVRLGAASLPPLQCTRTGAALEVCWCRGHIQLRRPVALARVLDQAVGGWVGDGDGRARIGNGPINTDARLGGPLRGPRSGLQDKRVAARGKVGSHNSAACAGRARRAVEQTGGRLLRCGCLKVRKVCARAES